MWVFQLILDILAVRQKISLLTLIQGFTISHFWAATLAAIDSFSVIFSPVDFFNVYKVISIHRNITKKSQGGHNMSFAPDFIDKL